MVEWNVTSVAFAIWAKNIEKEAMKQNLKVIQKQY